MIPTIGMFDNWLLENNHLNALYWKLHLKVSVLSKLISSKRSNCQRWSLFRNNTVTIVPWLFRCKNYQIVLKHTHDHMSALFLICTYCFMIDGRPLDLHHYSILAYQLEILRSSVILFQPTKHCIACKVKPIGGSHTHPLWTIGDILSVWPHHVRYRYTCTDAHIYTYDTCGSSIQWHRQRKLCCQLKVYWGSTFALILPLSHSFPVNVGINAAPLVDSIIVDIATEC